MLMRAAQRMATPLVEPPLLRLTSPAAAAVRERRGYAAAETIMRSAVRSKRAPRPEPAASRTRPDPAH